MLIMYPTVQRKNDNKIFYFRDEDSRDEFLDIHDDEEFINFSYTFKVPFGEEIFDLDSSREELESLIKISGISNNNIAITSDMFYNDIKTDQTNDFDHTDERVEAAMKQYNKVYTMDKDNDNELITTEDNPDEIKIRKNKLLNVRIFKSFYDSLQQHEKNAVVQAFKEKQLDIDKLDEYCDQEINMNIDIFLTNYKSEKQMKKSIQQYKETDEYKAHKNFLDAIELAYERVQQLFSNNQNIK